MSANTPALSVEKSIKERLFDLAERIILWVIREKCPMNTLGKYFLKTGGALMAPTLFIEVLKVLEVTNPFIKRIDTYDKISLGLGIFLFSAGTLIIVLNCFGFFKNFLLDKKVIIKQYSMGAPTFNPISKLKKSHKLIEFDIVLSKFWKDRKIELSDVIKAIKYQDKYSKRILSLRGNVQEFSYFGIASHPFVARLAAKLGNEPSYAFYENDQSGGTGFHKLEDTLFSTNLRVQTKEIKNSDNLVLTIGITRPIGKEVIPYFLKDNNYLYIEHETANKLPSNIDVIKSSQQLKVYRDFIKSEIIKLHNIKTIHIFYSGQTSLMYSLISSFSENYEKYNIFVYHYTHHHYPWAIDIYEPNYKKALFITPAN